MEAAKNKAAVLYIPQLLEAGAHAWRYTGVTRSEAIQYALMFGNIEAVEYWRRIWQQTRSPVLGGNGMMDTHQSSLLLPKNILKIQMHL
jgi:hypothetical protein